MVNINIELKEETHKKAKILALTNDITLKEYITRAIKEKIEKG